ncbi:MAG: hypothetical protein HYX94_08680 [Chloroflexi bacterium]|nr:hypothetical protein [Chloroflexota bacterium]
MMTQFDVPMKYPQLPARITLESAPMSVEQEIELISRQGGNSDWIQLRKRMLAGLGIMDKFRSRAKNVIFFGCTYPASTGLGFNRYLELLDELGIEYTFPSEGEYCCGFMALLRAQGEQQKARAEAAVKDFIGRNIEIASALGAEGCCTGVFGVPRWPRGITLTAA